MSEVTLYVENTNQQQVVNLTDEVSFGRSNLAQISLEDSGLSRLHATIFREGESVWIVDEKSTNGTFVNGERVFGEKKLADGDEISIGNETKIYVEILRKKVSEVPLKQKKETVQSKKKEISAPLPSPSKNNLPIVPLIAGISAFAIITTALLAIFLLGNSDKKEVSSGVAPTPRVLLTSAIPIRVTDPLGGENPDDLDDLIAAWEVEEEELKAENLTEISSVSTADITKPSDLNVSIDFWKKQKEIAMQSRPGGIAPSGMSVPRQLFGDGVIKQKRKLAEMLAQNYQQPMDFAELAQKRLRGELIELPMATDSFFLDVGGSAGEGEFTAFDFNNCRNPNDFDTCHQPILSGSPKHRILSELANNFDGQKYDLSNPRDRKQMRIRLLRMFHPKAREILREIAEDYKRKFNRPLRVTSLTRSMDYQISLNKTNANSFMVRGKGSLPPHTSGCAFDLARKHMTAEEQNAVMQKLAELENRQVLDALIEYGTNACFHVFIYPDGQPPK